MKILIEEEALKALSKIPDPYAKNITKKIKTLAGDPLPQKCKKLKGTNLFRIRSGNYRIIYNLEKKQNLIRVLVILHRCKAYKNL